MLRKSPVGTAFQIAQTLLFWWFVTFYPCFSQFALPAQAGIQLFYNLLTDSCLAVIWIPACAGKAKEEILINWVNFLNPHDPRSKLLTQTPSIYLNSKLHTTVLHSLPISIPHLLRVQCLPRQFLPPNKKPRPRARFNKKGVKPLAPEEGFEPPT